MRLQCVGQVRDDEKRSGLGSCHHGQRVVDHKLHPEMVEKALTRLREEKESYRALAAFAARSFGGFAGYAQEYLNHDGRMHARKQECDFSEQ